MNKSSTIYHLRHTIYKPAFTIVELLVVIVVIGILAAITIVSYTGISGKATVASLQSDLANASKQLKLDQVLNNNYPTNLADAINRKIISYDSNTTPTYVVNNNITPQVFCLSYTKNSQTYKVTETGTTTTGDCTNYLPVLYLDAGNTASYSGTGTTWTDLSGLGNNGTLVNGVGYTSANGGALSFDGITKYISISDSASLRVEGGNFTVSTWIKPTVIQQQTILFKSNTSMGNGYILVMNRFGNDISLTKGGVADQQSLNTFIANNWYQITAVQTLNSNVTYYINSLLLGSYSSSSNYFSSTGQNLYIGDADTFFANKYNGLISNISIYNRALSSTEITQNFNNTKARYGL